MAAGRRPAVIVLAGSNGAGKTTFFEQYVQPLRLPFINADRLAAALRANDPSAPPSVIDRRAFEHAEVLRRAFVEARVSFCTETVLSDEVGAKLRFLRDADAAGFDIVLIFIGLDSALLSVARVIQRVQAGGHDVADEKLHARFPRTLRNLAAAIPVVGDAILFDNTSDESPYRLVAVYERGRLARRITPLPRWTEGLPGL